jgi:hypothetical protein
MPIHQHEFEPHLTVEEVQTLLGFVQKHQPIIVGDYLADKVLFLPKQKGAPAG